jgi:protein TonB
MHSFTVSSHVGILNNSDGPACMFNNLIESKRKSQRSLGGTTFSIILHGVLIVLAVFATANAAIQEDDEVQEKIEFVETPEDTPEPDVPEPEPPPPPPDVVAAPPAPKGFQVLQAPVDIPDVIPEIDLTRKVTDELDFSGKGVAGGIAKGIEGAPPPPVVTDQPYFEFQVEKQVAAAPNSAQPRYPEMLRSAGIAGTVLAEFVVDTTGRVESGSFRVIESDHEQFTQAVRQALPRMRFYPAEIGGRKVKQLVQQPFVFAIQ